MTARYRTGKDDDDERGGAADGSLGDRSVADKVEERRRKRAEKSKGDKHHRKGKRDVAIVPLALDDGDVGDLVGALGGDDDALDDKEVESGLRRAPPRDAKPEHGDELFDVQSEVGAAPGSPEARTRHKQRATLVTSAAVTAERETAAAAAKSDADRLAALDVGASPSAALSPSARSAAALAARFNQLSALDEALAEPPPLQPPQGGGDDAAEPRAAPASAGRHGSRASDLSGRVWLPGNTARTGGGMTLPDSATSRWARTTCRVTATWSGRAQEKNSCSGHQQTIKHQAPNLTRPRVSLAIFQLKSMTPAIQTATTPEVNTQEIRNQLRFDTTRFCGGYVSHTHLAYPPPSPRR